MLRCLSFPPCRGIFFLAPLCLSLCLTPAVADAGAAGNTFDVMEFAVEGSTLLPQIDIERAVYPFLGEKKTLSDVEAAKDALEKSYRDRGYLTVLVDIPPQSVSQGVVILKVTEAPVEKLRVKGSRYYSLGDIREGVPSLAEGSVPNFNDLQKELGELNRSPGRNVAPVMRPGQTPGTVEAELQVKDEFPLHASVELNNHYSLNTTETRLSGQIRYDNLWQLQHSLSLYYMVTPEDPSETQAFSASYVIPGKADKTYVLYAVHSKSQVASVGDLNLLGNGDIVGLRVVKSLPTFDGINHSLSLGVDYKHFNENVKVATGESIETPVAYLPFSAQYNASLAQPSGSSTQVDAGLTFLGRGVLSRLDDFANKRALADTAFVVLRTGVQHTQVLPENWQLFGRLDTQLASGPLVSNEQITAGGASTVRGYLESEILGDAGARWGLELRTPRLPTAGLEDIKSFYALAFAEGAHLRVLEPLPQQQARFDIASAGVGLRLEGRGLTLELNFGHAFRSAGTAVGNTRAGDNRLSFRGKYDF